jgi:hypothetical protein
LSKRRGGDPLRIASSLMGARTYFSVAFDIPPQRGSRRSLRAGVGFTHRPKLESFREENPRSEVSQDFCITTARQRDVLVLYARQNHALAPGATQVCFWRFKSKATACRPITYREGADVSYLGHFRLLFRVLREVPTPVLAGVDGRGVARERYRDFINVVSQPCYPEVHRKVAITLDTPGGSAQEVRVLRENAGTAARASAISASTAIMPSFLI